MKPLNVIDLGRRPYLEVLELQRTLCRDRAEGVVSDDLLLLVEHEPVITLGRSTAASSLPVPREQIVARGIEVHEVERGGDVTWHGPGQLVGYPIIDLQQLRPDLHWYLRSLEDGLIDALERCGVPADRNPGYTGVWTAGRKIASIGVHVKRWVTLHGFALNVTNQLDHFDLIVPCGISQVVMTSVAEERGHRDDPTALLSSVKEAVVTHVARSLGRAPAMAPLPPSPFALHP